MNGLEFLWDGSVWQQQAIRLSLTLLHFVWQGVLVGLVAAVALTCFRRKSASTRYLIACVAFFGLPLLAAATFWLVEKPADVALVSPVSIESGPAVVAEPPTFTDSSEPPRLIETTAASVGVMPSESPSAPLLEITPVVDVVAEPVLAKPTGLAAIYWFLPWVAAAYVIGAVVLLLRLQVRIWRGSRLCSRSPAVQDPSLLELATRLAKQAGLKCVPTIRYCDRVVVPTVVGILKPVVLVPASLISQLTPDELSAILNHELAHIRRWDPVVQVVQKTVEALLFFHPVTWWLSRRIRIERENCCDDIASRDSGQLSYAAALLRMAELCVGKDKKRSTALANLAADGNNKTEFALRIRRLIGADDTPSFSLSSRGVLISAAIVMLASVSFAASATNPRISKAESTPTAEETLENTERSESDSAPLAVSDETETDKYSVVVRFVGGDQAKPIPGLQVTVGIGYGKEAKKYGPFTTDKRGRTKVSVPATGDYYLKLDSASEMPWISREKQSNGKSGPVYRSLQLFVTDTSIEKPGGARVITEDEESVISFNLIRGCELVLRAVDADTGEGISGAEFYEQNALREDWAHEISARNIGYRKPVLTKDRRTNSEGLFTRYVGPNEGYAYGVERVPPGYKLVKWEEVELNTRFGTAKAEHTFKFKRIENIMWSKKNRNGLVAGAKLLSATGKLEPGDPVVVQFLLKNDSDKEQTFVLQASDPDPTLGADNRLGLRVWGSSQNTFQHTLKPGEILEERQYRVTVDTTGMPPGKYHITTDYAFWQTKKDKPNSATGIPFRREIPFTLGDPKLLKQKQPPVDENPETKIYWGKPSGNLILGMRLQKGREINPEVQFDIQGQLLLLSETLPKDQIDIRGQLFLFNAGDDEIELTYELPANPADWNMHVTSRDNDKFVPLDSTWYSWIEPQRTRTITVPQWGQVAITGIRAEVTTDGKTVEEMTKGIKRTAVEMIKGPTLRIMKEETKFKYGDPKRLINQQGRFNFEAALTIHQSGLDATIVASSAPVPFEIKTDGDKESPVASPSKSD